MKEPIKWNLKEDNKPCCVPIEHIKIENLSLSYGGKFAFQELNAVINKKCITGIIGPSGCGKSSFLQSLNRMSDLLDDCNVNGQIYVEKQNILSKYIDIVGLRKKIGLIFQEPIPLPLSIYDNIRLPLKEHCFDKIEQRIEDALRDVGLWNEVKDKLHESAFHLSGGQKQRLCIARAIALEPEILLMDEPCSSLDPISSEKVEKLIEKLKCNFTIVIVTHNLAQARRVCDHLIAFWYDETKQCGMILESGTNVEIFEKPQSLVLRDYIAGTMG